jgi:hypothetical protein
MSDRINDSTFRCGDQSALIGYLYDECEPEEREAIAAHLATCTTCAREIAGLGATRRMLPAWTPPTPALGFQIASGDRPSVTATASWGLIPGASKWWQRPLPAWAQAAAAVAIFSAGLFAGLSDDPAAAARAGAPSGVASAPADQAPAAERITARIPEASGGAAAVSRDDLARLEQTLRAELARIERMQRGGDVGLLRASVPPQDDGVTIERVEALIQESELRQRQALREGMAEAVADFDARRFRQLGPMLRTVEDLREETLTHRRELNILGNAVVGSNQLVLRTSGSGR